VSAKLGLASNFIVKLNIVTMINKGKLIEGIDAKSQKNQFKIFIGIDVSKLKLDVSVVMMGIICTSFQVENKASGFKKLLKRVEKLPDYRAKITLFCMESTSIYHLPLADFLAKKEQSVWVENPYQIKHSLGLVRGKNDKTDARKIGEYAYRHSDKFRPFEPASIALKKLEAIHKQRSKLLKIKHQLTLEIKEYQSLGMNELATIKKELSAPTVESIENAIKESRKKMEQIIDEDEALKTLYKLIITVEGVDLLVGVYLLVATGGFKKFTNAKKFACQIGIAPFEHQSGSSLKKQKGTSNFADKLGKKMITNSVGCAIRTYGGLRSYYERKVKEGKPEGRVLNACKNKLLHRIFAVVKSGKPYDRFHEWKPNKAS
jgi:transposase